VSTAVREKAPALALRELEKAFGAVRALRGVSFDVHAGETVGLVGDNGAGKSTLVSLISGTARPDAGQILVDGLPHDFLTPSEAQRAGIETVFQFLSLVPSLDIASNMFLGRELPGPGRLAARLGNTDKRRMRREVAQILGQLGLSLPPPKTKVSALSGGQRQAVALMRAVYWGRHIVVLDEPTAALGVDQTRIVLDFIRRLRDHGVAVIFISHNMEHVFAAADRIVVLRLGEVVFEGARSDVTPMDIVALITGAVPRRS
jgi:ABC-type sugar transport system ATPase subunit